MISDTIPRAPSVSGFALRAPERVSWGCLRATALRKGCARRGETCATLNIMSHPRRGKTRTLSISVDAVTDKILKEEARAHFDGNVSRLVAAIALEARRKAAVERIAEWSGYASLS